MTTKQTTDNPLADAIAYLATMPKIDIRGKQYSNVASRVEVFRRYFPTYSLVTELLPADEPMVRVRATIANGAVCATGMAEENRNSGAINKTSALENCETSAIGRALAAFGLHGGEYATADEVVHAIQQQGAATQQKANPSGDGYVTTEQALAVEKLAKEVGADKDKFLAYMQVPEFIYIASKDYGRAMASLEKKRKAV